MERAHHFSAQRQRSCRVASLPRLRFFFFFVVALFLTRLIASFCFVCTCARVWIAIGVREPAPDSISLGSV